MRMRYQFIFVLLAVTALLGFSADAALSGPPTLAEEPTPSLDIDLSFSPSQILDTNVLSVKLGEPPIAGAPPLLLNWSALSFDDNSVNVGTWFIPPDPIGASGPNHVVNVCNVSIQWYDKFGAIQNNQGLNTFFAPLGPPLGTFTFDPKVIYDQYAERFVVISLEQTTGPNGSFILVAVSKTSDPNAGWWFHAINSRTTLNGIDSWADYPGLAIDDKAIYITNNMFGFAGGYAGSLLWIVNKNPFYAGGAAGVTVHDPYGATAANGSIATTTQPTHMFGAVPGAMGTWLVSHSGLNNGVQEFLQFIRVDNPLGAVTFTHQFLSVGDIDNVAFALPDAAQFGTAALVEVNDRRALNAVWRDGQLYTCATIRPNAGADVGQTTAHWWRCNAMPAAISLADQGDVGAEDIGAGTYTFFPSVAVDKCGGMAIGFAACNQSFYPGAYYTGRFALDAAGTVQPTGVLQAGTDYYFRTFGGSRNRWGDYSGISIDPTDEATFWVYNEHSMTRGTVFASLPTEDGRWDTHWGSFNLNCNTVSVAILGFVAREVDGVVELNAQFSADFDQFRVNIYRQDERLNQPVRYKSIEMNGTEELTFVDRYVEPGKTYSYHIGTVDRDGEFFSPVRVVTISSAAAELGQNEPNPFNPTTTIAFTLPATQTVSLVVYDATGRTVRTLVEGVRTFGTHREVWDGTDNSGNRVGSGIYFYRLKAGSFVESKKMVLLK